MMKNYIILFLFLVLFSACAINNTTTIWVDDIGNNLNDYKNPSLKVQKNNKIVDGAWINLLTPIHGFEYEPGYLYQLEVRKNIPSVDGTYDFDLVEVIQKINKNKKVIYKNESLAHKWILSSYLNSAGDYILIDETVKSIPLIEFDMNKMRMHGSDGCNRIGSTIKYLTSNRVELGLISGTKRGCRNYELPEQFNNLLQNIKFYKIEDSTLQLMDKNHQLLLTFIKKQYEYKEDFRRQK